MSLLISTKAELIKTKRSASFWLSVTGAAVIPLIFFLAYVIKPEKSYAQGWDRHLIQGWQAFNAFLLPMFVILICSLLPQIEYKNNTWKQVFASPQSIGGIFFSKWLTILIMILFLFLLFNIFLLLSGVVPNLFFSKFNFLSTTIDWVELARLNFKTFVSLLGIISIQYWVSLRFRNFIVPIGIGLGLLVTALIIYQFRWEHVYKVPYALPVLTMEGVRDTGGPLLQNHELNSVGYFIFFTLLAFLDMRFRKERG
ncbi:ABC transporter permease [Terrimonas alba]|uniref:ABC transporter permease n=1 Tax=Terrimonas alba TaxID=3349636 RepID=UPI0035F36B98